MLDDPEDVIGACLQKLGYPFGSTDEHQLQGAKNEAVRQKQFLRAYLNAEVRDQLVSGDVLAAQLWSTTAAQAIHSDAKTNLAFVYPAEGYPLYCDCAAILRESSRSGSPTSSRIPSLAGCSRCQRARSGNGDRERRSAGQPPARPDPLSPGRYLRPRRLAHRPPVLRPALSRPPLDRNQIGVTRLSWKQES